MNCESQGGILRVVPTAFQRLWYLKHIARIPGNFMKNVAFEERKILAAHWLIWSLQLRDSSPAIVLKGTVCLFARIRNTGEELGPLYALLVVWG